MALAAASDSTPTARPYAAALPPSVPGTRRSPSTGPRRCARRRRPSLSIQASALRLPSHGADPGGGGGRSPYCSIRQRMRCCDDDDGSFRAYSAGALAHHNPRSKQPKLTQVLHATVPRPIQRLKAAGFKEAHEVEVPMSASNTPASCYSCWCHGAILQENCQNGNPSPSSTSSCSQILKQHPDTPFQQSP